jgi:hypothetical protein
MPFAYARHPHARKHGPVGTTDYKTFKPWLRDEFQFRCVYCLERERWYPSGHEAFGVDHVCPQGDPAYAELVCDYENLVYACNRCNSIKRSETLLDPCRNALAEHLRVDKDGLIFGLSDEGKELVRLLDLADATRQAARKRLFLVLRCYEFDPDDPLARELYHHYFGYPDDLPDLGKLRPESNSRPSGIDETYFRQRRQGRLPTIYF